MARPRFPEPSSRLLRLVRGQFPTISDLELAFVARIAGRGHAAHLATLLGAGSPSGARGRTAHTKAKRRAAELEIAWGQVSALLALADLAEEASPDGYVPSPREIARLTRLMFEPECLTGSACLGDALPPREHLPERLPELLRDFFPSAAPTIRRCTRAPASAPIH